MTKAKLNAGSISSCARLFAKWRFFAKKKTFKSRLFRNISMCSNGETVCFTYVYIRTICNLIVNQLQMALKKPGFFSTNILNLNFICVCIFASNNSRKDFVEGNASKMWSTKKSFFMATAVLCLGCCCHYTKKDYNGRFLDDTFWHYLAQTSFNKWGQRDLGFSQQQRVSVKMQFSATLDVQQFFFFLKVVTWAQVLNTISERKTIFNKAI